MCRTQSGAGCCPFLQVGGQFQSSAAGVVRLVCAWPIQTSPIPRQAGFRNKHHSGANGTSERKIFPLGGGSIAPDACKWQAIVSLFYILLHIAVTLTARTCLSVRGAQFVYDVVPRHGSVVTRAPELHAVADCHEHSARVLREREKEEKRLELAGFGAGILQSLTPLLAPRTRRSRIAPAPEERDEAKEISAIGEVWPLSPCIELPVKLLSPPGLAPGLVRTPEPRRYSFCRQTSGADERRHSPPTPCRAGHFLLLSAFPSTVFASLVSAVCARIARAARSGARLSNGGQTAGADAARPRSAMVPLRGNRMRFRLDTSYQRAFAGLTNLPSSQRARCKSKLSAAISGRACQESRPRRVYAHRHQRGKKMKTLRCRNTNTVVMVGSVQSLALKSVKAKAQPLGFACCAPACCRAQFSRPAFR